MRIEPDKIPTLGMGARLAALVAAGLGLSLAVLGGCGGSAKKKKPQKYKFPIEVEVTNTKEEPIPEVPVKIDDNVAGYTDKNGSFRAIIKERPGTSVSVATGSMDGYRYVDDQHQKTTQLKVKKNISGKGLGGVPVLLNTVVESTQNWYLVWLKTKCDEDTMDEEDCRDLPVEIDGEVVAHTDRTGVAEFAFESDASGKRRVTIDTPSSSDDGDEGPTYEPEDPTFEFKLNSKPAIYWAEQSFEDPEAEEETTWSPPPSSSNGGGGGSSDDGGSSSEDSSDSEGDDDKIIDLFGEKK